MIVIIKMLFKTNNKGVGFGCLVFSHLTFFLLTPGGVSEATSWNHKERLTHKHMWVNWCTEASSCPAEIPGRLHKTANCLPSESLLCEKQDHTQARIQLLKQRESNIQTEGGSISHLKKKKGREAPSLRYILVKSLNFKDKKASMKYQQKCI